MEAFGTNSGYVSGYAEGKGMEEEQHKCFTTFHFEQHPVDLSNRHLWGSFFYY